MSDYPQRPSRLSRVDLGFNKDEDLDYSDQSGPSNSSRHMAVGSSPRPPASRYSHHSPPDRQTRPSEHRYHDVNRPAYPRPPPPPYPRRDLPQGIRGATPSPEPDEQVLAYIRAQKHDDTTPASELRLAEQLKKEKFQHGTGKVKSRVQKEREAEERKKKQAEQDAAKAYDEFVAAMQGDVADDKHDQHRGKDKPRKTASFVAAGGKAYVGSRAIGSDSNAKSTPSLKRVSDAFGDESDDEQDTAKPAKPAVASKDPPRKRQAMTSFLSELQTTQAERESRLSSLAASSSVSISTLLAHETLTKPGSRDLGSDPLTTNICIPNLPPHTDERVLADFFREWGDVATVKIMWPRGEQRERLAGLTGFVAYMTRAEAEAAFKQADGVMWGGNRLKLSWSKAMPLPNRALYPMQKTRKTEEIKRESGKSAVPRLVIRHRRQEDGKPGRAEEVARKVEAEYDQRQRLFVETVASRIRTNGAHFEQILREKEADNPKFSFLFDETSLLHHYLRLCLDPHYLPPHQEGYFSDTGSDSLYSTDSGEESETRRLSSLKSATLGPLARRRLIRMLRSLTLRRERIARLTAFALDHAAHYPTIVSLLTSSLLIPTTPVPRKIARLYALSDLLHNSGTLISNAWRYRGALESQLPLIFAHLGQIARSFTGRIKREEFRAKVLHVLHVWERWIVVGPHVLERLTRLFDDPPLAVEATKDVDVDDAADVDPDVDGEPLSISVSAKTEKQEEQPDQEEDLDGEAL